MKMLIITYAFFIILFTFFSYLFIDPNFFYLASFYTGIAYSSRLLVSTIYGVFILIFFGFYIYILIYVKKQKINFNELRWLLITLLILTLSYPAMLSYDIFNYLATAKVTFFYLENPYQVMPIEFLNDTMLLYTRAANKYALYGPTWIVLTGIPFYLSFGSVLFQVFLFKLLVILFYIGTLFVLYKMTKNYYSIVLFGLNPLVIVETFVSGHNDIVMVFFMLLALFLLKEDKTTRSFIALFLSIFIKFASVFLLPIWVYTLYMRRKSKEVVWSRVWTISFILMLVIFLLSPVREELYPWYFIWLLPFVALIRNNNLSRLSISLSFGLLFYYIPYMYTGYYILILKTFFILIPSAGLYLFLKYLSKRAEI